jgi:ACS family pantothenate transporter-like MFS transporter
MAICKTVTHVFRSWAQEICRRDSEERAIVIGFMNTMGQVVQAWLPLIVFQQVHAPRYYTGWVTVSVLNVCVILATLGLWWLHKNEDVSRDAMDEVVSGGSEASETVVKVK